MEIIDTSSSSCRNRCRSGHMTGLHRICRCICFPTVTAVMLSVSGPLKTFPSRCSIWLCLPNPGNQLQTVTVVANFYTSRKPAAGFSQVLLTTTGVFSHLSHQASDGFITPGLMALKGELWLCSGLADSSRSLWVPCSHASDVAWPCQGLAALLDRKARLNELFVTSWSMRV